MINLKHKIIYTKILFLTFTFKNNIANNPSSIFYFISFIDSNYLFYMIEEENRKKPVLFNFENWGSRRNDNQHVKLQTEYRLYTYYNSTKYYLDIKGLKDYSKNLELRSTESKNTVKGSLHI